MSMKNNAESSVRHFNMQILVLAHPLIKMRDFNRIRVYPAMKAAVDHHSKHNLAQYFGYSGQMTPETIQKIARQVLKFGCLINTFRHEQVPTTEPGPEVTATSRPSPFFMETELQPFMHAPTATQPRRRHNYDAVPLLGHEHSHPEHSAEVSSRMARLEKSAIPRGFPMTSDKKKAVVNVMHFTHPLLYAVMNAGITEYLTHFPHLRTMYNSDNPLPPSSLTPSVGIVSGC